MASPDWNAPAFASIPAGALLTDEVRRRLDDGTLTAHELLPLQQDEDAREDAQVCSETTRRYRLEQRARWNDPESDPST